MPALEFYYPLYPNNLPPTQENPDGVDPRNWITLKGLGSLEVTGAVTGTLVDGIVATTLTPIMVSQITDFSTSVTNLAKSISLNQFAVTQANINLNGFRLTNSATPTGSIDSDVATVGYVKQFAPAQNVSLTGDVTGVLSNGIIATTLKTLTSANISGFNTDVSSIAFDVSSNLVSGINVSGAVEGIIDGTNIFTTLNQVIPIEGKYSHFIFQDTMQYGDPYYTDYFLPSNDPSPIYRFISQTGTSINDSLRNCTISMYQGLATSVQSHIDFSIYHSLLPNTKTITPLSLGYSIADSKAKISVDGIMDLNSNIIRNLADPINPKDATNKLWVENLVAGGGGGGTINLTGSVTGSGTGTIDTSFNRYQTIDNVDNTQTWTYNYNVTTGQIVSYHNTILSDTSASTRKFIDRVARKSLTDNQFQWEHDIAGQSISDYQSIKMNFVNGSNNPGTSTVFSANKINNVVTASFNSPLGILDGTLSSHAVTKSQLDNKKLNEFGVTSDLDLGVYKISSSTAPTEGNHFCNKTYVDSFVSPSWTSYTCNIFTTGGTAPVVSSSTISAYYSINGKNMLVQIRGTVVFGYSGQTGFPYYFTLPSGITVNKTITNSVTSLASTTLNSVSMSPVGLGNFYYSGAPRAIINHIINSSITSGRGDCVLMWANPSGGYYSGAEVPNNSTVYFAFNMSIPIN